MKAHKQRMAWESLRKDIAKYGLRHSTLYSTNAHRKFLLGNETNGIEPEHYLPRKAKKDQNKLFRDS